MNRQEQKLTFLLWIVIAVLVLGGGVALYMLVHKADDLQSQNDVLTGDNDSLKRQIVQLKSPTPTVTPDPGPSPTPTDTPTPVPTPTGKTTISPTPK
jgi:hypothetical protein